MFRKKRDFQSCMHACCSRTTKRISIKMVRFVDNVGTGAFIEQQGIPTVGLVVVGTDRRLLRGCRSLHGLTLPSPTNAMWRRNRVLPEHDICRFQQRDPSHRLAPGGSLAWTHAASKPNPHHKKKGSKVTPARSCQWRRVVAYDMSSRALNISSSNLASVMY